MNRPYDSRPRPPTRLAFHPSRIVIDAGVLLVLGAMSLPFVTGEVYRQRAVAGDALPALLLLLPVFVMTLVPDHSAPLPRPLSWTGLALGAAALPYTVVKYLDASTLAGTVQGGVGMGARLLVLGAFTTLAGAALGLLRAGIRPTAAGAEEAESGARPSASPARRPLPAGDSARARSAGAGRAPSARRRSTMGGPQPAASSAPTPAAGPPAPAGRPSARTAPRPRPADPDTEPTVPAQRPVQPWWPDDLEDLFS